MSQPVPLFSHRPYWAARFGMAPVLPMSRDEMERLGWDSCDIIIVTGDAYVDHPSFGMTLIGRLLESQGFRVGITAQPDWSSAESFRELGAPPRPLPGRQKGTTWTSFTYGPDQARYLKQTTVYIGKLY